MSCEKMKALEETIKDYRKKFSDAGMKEVSELEGKLCLKEYEYQGLLSAVKCLTKDREAFKKQVETFKQFADSNGSLAIDYGRKMVELKAELREWKAGSKHNGDVAGIYAKKYGKLKKEICELKRVELNLPYLFETANLKGFFIFTSEYGDNKYFELKNNNPIKRFKIRGGTWKEATHNLIEFLKHYDGQKEPEEPKIITQIQEIQNYEAEQKAKNERRLREGIISQETIDEVRRVRLNQEFKAKEAKAFREIIDRVSKKIGYEDIEIISEASIMEFLLDREAITDLSEGQKLCLIKAIVDDINKSLGLKNRGE